METPASKNGCPKSRLKDLLGPVTRVKKKKKEMAVLKRENLY